MDSLDDSGFVSASVEGGAAEGSKELDPMQFSFFGDLSAVDDGLGGALEEGLEAPPEEEELVQGIEYEDEEEDLSYAGMFANVLGKGDGVDAIEQEEPLFLSHEEQKQDTSTEFLSFLSGNIGLGGLLTATTPSEDTFGQSSRQQLLSPGLLEQSLGILPSPQRHAGQSIPPSSSAMVHGGALTPQELEAQLRQRPSPPVLQQQGGFFTSPGAAIPQRSTELLQHEHVPADMQAQLNNPPMQTQPGVFTPEMIMQQQRQHAQSMGTPPHMHVHQQHVQPQMPPPHLPRPPHAPLQSGPWVGGPILHPPPMPPPHQVLPPPGARGPHGMNLAQRLKALNLAEPPSMAQAHAVRRKQGSRCMSKDEIESILYIQWKPLHIGAPYVEDYYFQAFLDKHYSGKNKKIFAPESVRELAPTEKVADENIAFVKLEGLGRVPFSNVRRPRPLMDFSVGQSKRASAGEAEEEKTHVKRLEQEPALAARIMTEDCMALLLDVQDVDRIFIASGGEGIENESALKQRRVLLLEGLASSLRLSETPDGKDGSDAVFLKLLSLNKGRVLAARALKLASPPEEMSKRGVKVNPNYRVLWAVLRNAKTIFGDVYISMSSTSSSKESIKSIQGIARSLISLLRKIPSPHALGDALIAVCAGALFDNADVKFFSPGDTAISQTREPWLCDVLAALLARGEEFDLAQISSSSDQEASVWTEGIRDLYSGCMNYLKNIGTTLSSADSDTAKTTRELIPVPFLGQYLLKHCTVEQKEKMQDALVELDV